MLLGKPSPKCSEAVIKKPAARFAVNLSASGNWLVADDIKAPLVG